MKKTFALLFGLTAAACAQPAPPPAPPPPPPSTAIVSSLKAGFEMVKGYVTQAAEQIPEAKYSYQPTKEVRTIGQLIGHIADGNYLICGYSSGQAGPGTSAEKTLTKKADLQKALAESFAFCDKAYAALTNDAVGGQDVTMTVINNMKSTRAGAFAFNSAHDMEHYGNLVTYMRMNKMVPPSSAPR
jgi:uncharacterized damage-inducible protein DinB